MKFNSSLCVFCCAISLAIIGVININAQDRSRIVQSTTQNPINRESQPINQPQPSSVIIRQTYSSPISNPVSKIGMTNNLVVNANQTSQSLIRKTVSSQPLTSSAGYSAYSNRLSYSSSLNNLLLASINSKLGIPYRYGSMGPNRYDCSGFVWSVFKDAGVLFERSSAKTFWNEFEPVEGDARYQFGTLVFFNHLGHVGIVADENGFYQASSSKGITYSPFKGYWEKRIVGYRRIPPAYYQTIAKTR